MKQEEKELLVKDLCARLPYGVKVKFKVNEVAEIKEKLIYNIFGEYSYITDGKSYLTLDIIKSLFNNHLDEIKPYLFPLSSMTAEQKNDCPISETNLNIINSNIGYGIIEMPWRLSYLFVDWCNKNHFDYRGLIPIGAAIDATGLSVYTNSDE